MIDSTGSSLPACRLVVLGCAAGAQPRPEASVSAGGAERMHGWEANTWSPRRAEAAETHQTARRAREVVESII